VQALMLIGRERGSSAIASVLAEMQPFGGPRD
jgi:hypothetical protein